jgi:hypothetical protein
MMMSEKQIARGEGRRPQVGRARAKLARRYWNLERLEERVAPTVDLLIDSTGAVSWLGSASVADIVTASYSGSGLGSYTLSDTADTITVTNNSGGTVTVTGSGSNSVTLTNATANAITSLTFDDAGSGNSYTIESTAAGTTTTIQNSGGVGGSDTIILGNAGNAQQINGPVNIVYGLSGSTTTASVTLDDSADSSVDYEATISSAAITGVAPAMVSYSGPIADLTIDGGTGANTYTINGLPTATGPTTLNAGTGNDTVNVAATPSGSSLNISVTGPGNRVTLGNGGSTQNVAGSVSVVQSSSGGSTALFLDDSADTTGRTMTLGLPSSSSANSQILGLTPGEVDFDPSAVTDLTIMGGSGGNTMTIDFSNGNPLPTTAGGSFNYDGVSDILVLKGGSFSDEIYQAIGPGTGSITFDGLNPIHFSGLAPVIDTTTATNYTITLPASSQAVQVSDGSVVSGFQTTTIASSASGFESVSYANKTNVTIDASSSGASTLLLDNTTPATGQSSLTVQMGAFNDQVSLQATPSGVATTIDTNGGDDRVIVQATGLSTSAALAIDGGAGYNTLVLNTQGTTYNLSTPGTVAFGTGASLTYTNISEIDVNAPNPPPVIVVPPLAVTVPQGIPQVDLVVGSFTVANTSVLASEYTAVIDWGDGSNPTVGAIAESPTTAGTFFISGSHTFTGLGPYTVNVTVTDNGGTSVSYIGTVKVVTTAPPLPPVTGAGADVSITTLPISAQGVAVNGVRGTTLSNVLVATFTSSNPLAVAPDFTAMINWGDSTSSTGTITLINSSPNGTTFEVTGTHTYANSGTFQLQVSIIHTADGATAITTATATVAGSSLTLGTTSPVTATAGTVVSNVTLATFTDNGGPLPVNDYGAWINWGDGSSPSPGTISFSGTTFTVTGTHTYNTAGLYVGMVVIIPAGGPPLKAPLMATVNNPSLTFSSGLSAYAGTPSGPMILATINGSPTPTITGYTAQVDFGDGAAPQIAALVDNNGTLEITTSGHTFSTVGVQMVSVTLTDSGGQVVAMAGGLVSVSAPTITPIGTLFTAAGQPLPALTLATVSVPLFAGSAPLNVNQYAATVDWGDGSTPTAASLATATVPGSTAFDINASGHTYNRAGSFGVIITLRDALGAIVGMSTATATVAPLPITPSPLSIIAGQPLNNALLATVTVSTPILYKAVFPAMPPDVVVPPHASWYSVLVNWGDGTAPTAGLISDGNGAMAITGSHTYATAGTYTMTIILATAGNPQVATASFPVTVASPSLTLTGRLSPLSDSGISNSDGITNVTTPMFVGTSAPGAIISVYASPSGSGQMPGNLIATGVTNAAGSWTATDLLSPLAQGSYTITATTTNPAGGPPATASLGTILIDTVGPVVTNASFNRFTGQMTITFQDNLSGLDQRSLANGAFYHVTAQPLSPRVHVPGTILVTGLSVSPQTSPTAPQTVTLTLNGGQALRGGSYILKVGSGGIEDVAGNPLNGAFYGTFPTGSGQPGSNFVIQFNSFHNTSLAPVPIAAGYADPNGTSAPLHPIRPTFTTRAARLRVASVAAGALVAQSRSLIAQPATNTPVLDTVLAMLAREHPKHRGR